jgi:hypothetical protein
MVSYLNLDDVEIFNAKIDKNAHDLFKSKPGKPQLQVSRLLKTGTRKGNETVSYVRNQDVANISQMKALEHV